MFCNMCCSEWSIHPPVQGLVGNILSEGKNGASHLENTILKYETSISKGMTVLPFTQDIT